MICGAELGAALPTAAKPHVQASWRITEDPRTTNRISAIGLVGAIAVAVLIIVTRSNSIWMVAAAVTALLLFVGPLLIGVPTRLRKTKMTIELAPTDDGQLEVGETHRAEPIGEAEELIIGEELHSRQGLLVRRSLEHERPLQLRVGEANFRVEGTVLALSPLDETPIGEAAARRRFGLPSHLRLPAKLKVVRTGLAPGVSCLVAGPTGISAAPTGGYRDQRFERTFCGEPGRPVVLC